jgi:hypothetical protein
MGNEKESFRFDRIVIFGGMLTVPSAPGYSLQVLPREARGAGFSLLSLARFAFRNY